MQATKNQSGRTVGKMRRAMSGKKGVSSSQHNALRNKTQPQPRGKERFPNGKYKNQ